MKPKSLLSKILSGVKAWVATRLWQKTETRINKLNLAELSQIALNNDLSVVASRKEIRRLQNWTYTGNYTDYENLIKSAKALYYPKKIKTNLKSFSRQQLQAFEKGHIDEQLFTQDEKAFLLSYTGLHNDLITEATYLFAKR